MKLPPPAVNFINILLARFSYKSELSSFSLIIFGCVIFGTKILYETLARKTLMKLTTGGGQKQQDHME